MSTAVTDNDNDDNVISFREWLTGKPQAPPKAPQGHPRAPIDTSAADHNAYVQKAFHDEIQALSTQEKGGRNHALNVAALKLAGLPIDREQLRQALIDACTANGHLQEDGLAMVTGTINSAFRKADTDGPRTIPARETINQAATIDPADIKAEAEANDADSPTIAALEELEGGFWDSRDHLRLIYDAAIARMASPWAVLACCMARALAQVPPMITLPPIIGAEGSLNWFAAISAKSGGGKGAAMAVAERLIPLPEHIPLRGIGSGEGMIEVYQRSNKGSEKKDPPPPVISVLFSIEEIDSLGAMGGRSGQTTMAILRQGFSGEKLGYSYRGRQGETVDKHTYRMTVVASVQPERAGVLFDDTGGGTPQRFMWFPGRDKRITADPPPWPNGRINLPTPQQLGGGDYTPGYGYDSITGPDGSVLLRSITIPEAAARTIREARARSMSGDDEALDSHALFCREKFAFGLALLDGRTAVSEDDWKLSGTAAAVSDWCRAKAREGYARGKQRQARERGEMRGIENDERTIVEQAMSQKRIARIANNIVKYAQRHGAEREKEMMRHHASRDKPFFQTALRVAAESGLIVKQDDKWALP